MEHISAYLISSAEKIWAGYHTHPFVQGIADGTLPIEKFRRYLVQDYVYLHDYARVFSIGAAKAKDPEAMRLMADYVQQLNGGEMEIHRAYMKRLGISEAEAEQAAPSIDNLSYTSYMLRVAYEDGLPEILAAILSCAVSYEVIARRIAETHPGAEKHPFYGEWVEGYISEGYHEANEVLIRLTDRICGDLKEEQVGHLKDIFLRCSEYERMFWDMSWEMRQ